MNKGTFTTSLLLPAQAAAETEATIVKWHVAAGQEFAKGSILAEAESAKSTFEFEAPCGGRVLRLLCAEGAATPFDKPVIEVETGDESVKGPPAAPEPPEAPAAAAVAAPVIADARRPGPPVWLLGVGAYLPKRVVPTVELLADLPDTTAEYMFGVTGIRERRWADADEKPSGMALAASREAIRKSGLDAKDIDAIVVSTTTPDMAMPSTACILQGLLGLRTIPAFDINAACSGWLYAIIVARGLIAAGSARNVLVTGVDMQSRMLDKKDKNTYFLFGDGAGAAVISGVREGHLVREGIFTADPQGLHMARRETPGFEIPANSAGADPWVRLDGKALFRFATSSFALLIRQVVEMSGWDLGDVRWVVPHQANGRIIKAAANRSGIAFERFYLNIDRVGNTSSASIPVALVEIEKYLQPGDKIVLCTVGAGITAAALSIEW